MAELMVWYNKKNELHPFEKAAMFHSKFLNIHPFIDGNSRTARLLMNLELMKAGYLPIIIENEQRFKHFEILDIATVEENYVPCIQFVANYEKLELQRYVEMIEAHDNAEQ